MTEKELEKEVIYQKDGWGKTVVKLGKAQRNKSIYTQYCKQKLPYEFQKRAEGFASMSDTVQEEMFRAGFYCGIHLDEISTNPGNDFIVIPKSSLKELFKLLNKIKSKIDKEG